MDYFEDDREVDEGTAIAPQRPRPVKSQRPTNDPVRRATSPRKPMYEFGTDEEDEAKRVKSPPRMSHP